MPRAGTTPEPEFRRGSGPRALPKGAAQAANELEDELMPFDQQLLDVEDDDEEDEFVPSNEEDAFIFGPSGRPDEPITAGLPMGAGPNVSSLPFETREEFVNRVATRLETEVGNIPGLKKAIAKLRKGL